jgi:hypothetical protein
MEWGSSFDARHIGAPVRRLSRKSEVLGMKSDTENGRMIKFKAEI